MSEHPAERLLRVEKSLAILRVVSVVAITMSFLLLCATGFLTYSLMGKSASKDPKFRTLTIVDESGRDRVFLGSKGDNFGMKIMDRDGKRLLSAGQSETGGGGIWISNPMEVDVVKLGAGRDNAGFVAVSDHAGDFQQGLSGH